MPEIKIFTMEVLQVSYESDYFKKQMENALFTFQKTGAMSEMPLKQQW